MVVNFEQGIFHCDTGRIFKHEKTPEGFLRVWMTVSKVGKLLYRQDDGSTRTEYVSPKVLFDPKSLDTLWGKPITNRHPSVGRLDSRNALQFQKGMTQQGMLVNGDFLTVVGVISDQDTIEAIENGEINKVSAGYDTKLVSRNDGSFDQTDRTYNHISACSSPRAGDDVKIHIDETDISINVWRTDAIEELEIYNLKQSLSKNNSTQAEKKMSRKKRLDDELEVIEELEEDEEEEDDEDDEEEEYSILELDGQEYAIAPDIAEAIAGLQESNAELSEGYNELYTEKARLDGELAAAQIRLDEYENEDYLNQDEVDDAIAEEIELRLSRWVEVLPTLRKDDAEFNPDFKLPVIEIEKLYLRSRNPKLNLDEKDEGYVSGLYDGLKPNQDSNSSIKKTDDLFSRLDNMIGRTPESLNKDENSETDITRIRKERAQQIANNSKRN